MGRVANALRDERRKVEAVRELAARVERDGRNNVDLGEPYWAGYGTGLLSVAKGMKAIVGEEEPE